MKKCDGAESKIVGLSVAMTGTPDQKLIDLGYWIPDPTLNM